MPYKRKEYLQPANPPAEPAVNIAAISVISFYYNIKWESNEVFGTSLYEIDRILND